LHHSQVARIWAQWGIKPWREETFKFSTDPELGGCPGVRGS
jgi:hypothetical protein